MSESFRAVVEDVREEQRVAGRAVWRMALNETRFSVGDTGVLIAVSRKGTRLEAPVLRVVGDADNRIWHVVEKPLAAGTEVEGLVLQS